MTQTPTACYALYDGEAHSMPVYVSNYPSKGPWADYTYSIDQYHVMFGSKFLPPTTCQPYAFLCKTTGGNFFRLPEDADYYFGTDWQDWSWSDYDSNWGLSCEEQHYYNTGDEWIVNSGPRINASWGILEKEDIWYYAEYGGTCEGCQYIDTLMCLEECIYADTINTDQCNCDGEGGAGEYVDWDPWSDPSINTWPLWMQYVVLALAGIGVLAICIALSSVCWWRLEKKGHYHFGDDGSPKSKAKYGQVPMTDVDTENEAIKM